MGDKNDKKRKYVNVSVSTDDLKVPKHTYFLDDTDSDSESEYDSDVTVDTYNYKDESLELEKVDMNIKTLDDLIKLGKQFNRQKRYLFDMKKLNDMVPSMEKINDFIGMNNIKNHLVDQIIFYLQSECLDIEENDLMHTVITGPPGVGKTEFAKALGELYLAMGVLKNKIFKKVTRADMVAKYLGQTAIKTRDLIKSCKGGVMFIDEVYSLGNNELRDSFSKEAIDTLNEHLTEMKQDLICIVAGYKEDVNNCFFAYNKGLNSRFPIRFEIENYDYKELFLIFKQKIDKLKWTLNSDITDLYFKDKMDNLKYFGRDIENLITQIKRCHSRRVFTLEQDKKKKITKEDLEEGMKKFLGFKNKKIEKNLHMYL